MATIPVEIHTTCPELNKVWKLYALNLLLKPGLLIADTEEDLNWNIVPSYLGSGKTIRKPTPEEIDEGSQFRSLSN